MRAYRECGYGCSGESQGGDDRGADGVSTLDAIDAPVDYVSLYVPPAVGLRLLPAIAAKQPKEVWLNPGSEATS